MKTSNSQNFFWTEGRAVHSLLLLGVVLIIPSYIQATVTCTPGGGASYTQGQQVQCTSNTGEQFVVYWRDPTVTLFCTPSEQLLRHDGSTRPITTPAFSTIGSWQVCAKTSSGGVLTNAWPPGNGCNAPAGYQITANTAAPILGTISRNPAQSFTRQQLSHSNQLYHRQERELFHRRRQHRPAHDRVWFRCRRRRHP